VQSRPCQTETDTDRKSERDRSWKHTHPPRDKQDDDAVHAISRGPQGRERRDLGPVHDRHNRRWFWILFPFLFLFFLGVLLAPRPLPPSLSRSFFLPFFAGSLPSFLHYFLSFFAEFFFLFCSCFCTSDGSRSIPVPTQFAIERKEVQYILRIGEICLE
jgi:hypothetical protein